MFVLSRTERLKLLERFTRSAPSVQQMLGWWGGDTLFFSPKSGMLVGGLNEKTGERKSLPPGGQGTIYKDLLPALVAGEWGKKIDAGFSVFRFDFKSAFFLNPRYFKMRETDLLTIEELGKVYPPETTEGEA